MDKNIAALMRQDTRTVRVGFELAVDDNADNWVDVINGFGKVSVQRPKAPDSKLYTYVTHVPLTVGDLVIVLAAGTLKVAVVREVHDEVKIEPNSDIAYSWIVAKLDTSEWQATMVRNAELEKVVSDAYRVNLRRSFADQILAGIDPASKDRITALLEAPKP